MQMTTSLHGNDGPATAAADPAIEASGLVKAFGATRAVDGIDLVVPRGGVFGLLGPNGAGKTTAIRIFATLTRPDSGSARVLGHDVVADPHAARSQISLTGQFATIDPGLTGMENMILQGRLLGLTRRAARTRAAELLEAFDLAGAARRAVKTYSGGMQRRLDITASIVVPPALLFLDEPTTGLDPHSRNQVWETVRQLARQGATVLLTTQYLDEADQLSDRIAVLDHGKIIADGTPGQLKASVGSGVLRVRLAAPHAREQARQVLTRILGVAVRAEPDPAALTARIAHDPADQGAAVAAARVMSQLAHSGIEVTTFAFGQPSLDEVFLALTGAAARPADTQPTDTERSVA
jgi:ABC-2 type transport system ATP-binding protein